MSVIVADSASYADVAAAVALAITGDEVRIPAGTATWAQTLQINHPISLIGAGGGALGGSAQTIIKPALDLDPLIRVGGFEFWLNDTGGMSSDAPVRISQILFDGNNAGIVGIQPVGQKYNNVLGFPITQFRLDHCKFINWHRDFTPTVRSVNPKWYVYGVIDHCEWINNQYAVAMEADDDHAWARPVNMGGVDAMVIENCQITLSGNGAQEYGSQIYNNSNGARVVVRDCDFDATSGVVADPGFMECHGNQSYYTGDNNDVRGQIAYEIYRNTFRYAVSNYRFLYFRGGSIVFHSNDFTVTTKTNDNAIMMTEEESWQTALFPTLRTVWPANDQIFNSFFWNNTINGDPLGAAHISLFHANDAVFIQEGRDYFLHAPEATGGKETLPVGIIHGGYAIPDHGGPYEPVAGSQADKMTFSGAGANAYYPYTPLGSHPLVTDVLEPPVFTSASTLSGTAQVGETMTLTFAVDGDPTPTLEIDVFSCPP